MKKVIYFLLILFLLAACGQATAPEDESDAAEVPAVEAVPEPVEGDSEPEANIDSSAYDASATEAGSAEEETAVDAGFPMATSIEEAAKRRETDWVKGAEDPLITIIEYGDFQ